jgi:hypothetical protein
MAKTLVNQRASSVRSTHISGGLSLLLAAVLSGCGGTNAAEPAQSKATVHRPVAAAEQRSG